MGLGEEEGRRCGTRGAEEDVLIEGSNDWEDASNVGERVLCAIMSNPTLSERERW
jgi:hypothetical protein